MQNVLTNELHALGEDADREHTEPVEAALDHVRRVINVVTNQTVDLTPSAIRRSFNNWVTETMRATDSTSDQVNIALEHMLNVPQPTVAKDLTDGIWALQRLHRDTAKQPVEGINDFPQLRAALRRIQAAMEREEFLREWQYTAVRRIGMRKKARQASTDRTLTELLADYKCDKVEPYLRANYAWHCTNRGAMERVVQQAISLANLHMTRDEGEALRSTDNRQKRHIKLGRKRDGN